MLKLLAILVGVLSFPAFGNETPAPESPTPETTAAAEPYQPVLFLDREFASEAQGSHPNTAARVKADEAFIRETSQHGYDRAFRLLRQIYENGRIHAESRERALRTLVMRYERAPKRQVRAWQPYLQKILRAKKDPVEFKQIAYDSLIGQTGKAVPLMVGIAADPKVHTYIRFVACKDLTLEKLKPGQRQIVRNSLQQLLKSKEVKNADFDGLTEESVRETLRQL